MRPFRSLEVAFLAFLCTACDGVRTEPQRSEGPVSGSSGTPEDGASTSPVRADEDASVEGTADVCPERCALLGDLYSDGSISSLPSPETGLCSGGGEGSAVCDCGLGPPSLGCTVASPRSGRCLSVEPPPSCDAAAPETCDEYCGPLLAEYSQELKAEFEVVVLETKCSASVCFAGVSLDGECQTIVLTGDLEASTVFPSPATGEECGPNLCSGGPVQKCSLPE